MNGEDQTSFSAASISCERLAVEERQVEAGSVEVVEILDVGVAADEAAGGLRRVLGVEEAEGAELAPDRVGELLRQRPVLDRAANDGEPRIDPRAELPLALLCRDQLSEELGVGSLDEARERLTFGGEALAAKLLRHAHGGALEVLPVGAERNDDSAGHLAREQMGELPEKGGLRPAHPPGVAPADLRE